MALGFTFRASIFSTTAATSYATTSTYTPAANSLLVAFEVNSLASSPLEPSTFTGHGVTWTKVTLTGAGRLLSTTHSISIWVANAGASPSSAAATAGFGAVSQTGCAIIEYEITGADMTGGAVNAILQAITSTGTSNNVTATNLLNDNHAELNKAMAFWVHLANQATTEGGGNWSEPAGSDGNFNSPATGAEAQITATTYDRSPAASWATSSAYIVAAVEIRATQLTISDPRWAAPQYPAFINEAPGAVDYGQRTPYKKPA